MRTFAAVISRHGFPSASGDAQSVWIGERRLAAQNVDAVARQLIRDDRSLRARSPRRRARGVASPSGAAARDSPRCRSTSARQREHRFAKCLARNRSRGQADAADRLRAVRRSRRACRALRPARRRAGRPVRCRCTPGRSRRIQSRRHRVNVSSRFVQKRIATDRRLACNARRTNHTLTFPRRRGLS